MSALCDTVADCADGSDEAAARCEDTEPRVRLVAGNNVTSGRLEVRHHGVWGSGEMNISFWWFLHVEFKYHHFVLCLCTAFLASMLKLMLCNHA